MHPPIAAIILAAGQGSRMGGRPKAALHVDGVSLLERLAAALRANGVDAISAVIGPYAATLLPLAARGAIQPLRPPQEAGSLIDSQRLGLAAHAAGRPGHDLMLVLGDLPLLDDDAVGTLIRHWQARPPDAGIMQPIVDGVRGHPVILSARSAAAANDLPPGLGIRDWMTQQPGSVAPFYSEQRAYVTDLDTPEDIEALRKTWRGSSVQWPTSSASI
ncbi:NTP transferase domain-containing protein [Achromobacter sp. UMC71]|uniref:nucleotidyltransferase family protein n=1 Tax=Achromobacter sp. UMC71 TaxID=1862320 RepID=UPI0016038BE5|nr:NTP transferase domain-containing protein [Achromobacter sp. UMC71]MBB1623845.1 hypothetical protein [Achromobacter sp. UMC71]